MNNNTNIAEILKDCPKGMELDCLMYDNVTLDCVDIDCIYPIRITTKSGFFTRLTKYGQNVDNKDAKCVLYPKGKTTWDGFVPPCEFKDGEILSNGICICIYNGNESGKYYGFYVAVGHIDFPNYFINRPQNSYFTKENSRLATEEEKEKLFQAIKDNGYRWNDETKTLEKLAELKFKVGDKIQQKNQPDVCLVSEVRENYYLLDEKDIVLPFFAQDDWELVPNKFDITTLNPFDKVLVRYSNDDPWIAAHFSHYPKDAELYYPYFASGSCFKQCIPYEGNEHLLAKTDDCDDYYKIWKDETDE